MQAVAAEGILCNSARLISRGFYGLRRTQAHEKSARIYPDRQLARLSRREGMPTRENKKPYSTFERAENAGSKPRIARGFR